MKVTWQNTRVISDLEEIRKLKQRPGKDIHVVGGALFVSSMMNLGLRYPLKLVNAKPLQSGKVSLTYCTRV